MSGVTTPQDSEPEIEPYLMTILSKKFEAASRDMTQSLLKSARSGVINVARDFSSGITLYNGRQFMIDEGLPVHLGNIQLAPQYTLEQFEDINPGDCFLTNSPYAGNTHHADYTLHVPIFYDDEPLFWAINRAHQADVGAPEPSTYLAESENIYQEGPHFPSVKIQEEYEDKDDIVRICELNIRLGEEQWYGDYRAQIAAIREGEQRIQEIIDKYGIDVVKAFTSEWLDYGHRMMKNAIRDLPEAEVKYTAHHDPVPGAEEGVPVTVHLVIEPEEPKITIDLTENMDALPCGFNLCEATTLAGAYSGVFNNLNAKIPHNQGSLRPIEVKMDEETVVGKAAYPSGTSVATTNVCDTLFNAVQAAFGELGKPYGMAEGNPGMPPNVGVISGTDFRRDDAPYVNQIIYSGGGGPAVYGHDGWLTYGIPVTSGVLYLDSLEVDERKYPILFDRYELLTDTEGAGEWRGAPGVELEYGPRQDPMTVAYLGNGDQFPPQGILGGEAGASAKAIKVTDDGEEMPLPIISVEEIGPEERIVGRIAGGGGYGDPGDRDPAAVKEDVQKGVISRERAEDVYGVVFEESSSELTVDESATDARRDQLTTEGSQ
ncbi:hydantoinase B/oxoprolinase family protein [Natronococcus wangiae]|uniref:hydantoinase B/oxoprolinase family protein n=1 Tax=Natronococcus wangiae TaxID=3068275 RepID=UPI00273DBDA5|nr:hydantoinase B/oxoprolinase family protein [Natronococcus sp. AD5]